MGVTRSPCILWQMVGGCCCCPSLVEYPDPEEVWCARRVLPFPSVPIRDPAVAGWRLLEPFDVSAISFSPLFEVGFDLLD